MLDKYPNYGEPEIDMVLHEIGHPIDVAYKYQKSDEYLIHPKFYRDFILVLKFALITSTIVAFISGIIQSLLELDLNEPYKVFGLLFGYIFDNIFSFGFAAFFIVIIYFWSYKHPKIKERVDDKHTNWQIRDLPQVPKTAVNESLKSRTNLLFEMFFVIIISITVGILFLVYYDQFIVLVLDGVTIPVLNPDYHNLFVILVIGSWILMIITYLTRFYKGNEEFSTLLLRTITEFYSSVLLSVIFLLPNFILPSSILSFTDYFELNYDTVNNIWTVIRYSAVAIILLTSFISYFKKWVHYLKNKQSY